VVEKAIVDDGCFTLDEASHTPTHLLGMILLDELSRLI